MFGSSPPPSPHLLHDLFASSSSGITQFCFVIDVCWRILEVVIQAVVGNKVIARETIKPFRKDVLAKLHASDITRRRKLLEKQKEGRKRLRAVGNVVIDQSAFQSFLSK
jgi:translation elongation factor EF-4